MNAPRLLDVTLRDVASVNDWRFTGEQIAAVANAIDAAGFDFLEVGYFIPTRQIASVERTGPGVCDPDYLRLVVSELDHTGPAVMVRMSDVPLAALRELAAGGVTLVRLPINSHEVDQTADYVDACHDLGIRVRSISSCSVSAASKKSQNGRDGAGSWGRRILCRRHTLWFAAQSNQRIHDGGKAGTVDPARLPRARRVALRLCQRAGGGTGRRRDD